MENIIYSPEELIKIFNDGNKEHKLTYTSLSDTLDEYRMDSLLLTIKIRIPQLNHHLGKKSNIIKYIKASNNEHIKIDKKSNNYFFADFKFINFDKIGYKLTDYYKLRVKCLCEDEINYLYSSLKFKDFYVLDLFMALDSNNGGNSINESYYTDDVYIKLKLPN